MAEKVGIKETKEALLAVTTLGVLVAQRLKDGVQWDDAIALASKFNDAEFKAKVLDGINGINQIDEELKDLSFIEVLELAKIIPDLIGQVKGAL